MDTGIVKADGTVEEFDERKLLDSLVRSGADPENALEIVKEVSLQIKPRMRTKKIYRLAHRYLKRYNRASVLKYSLKEAMMRLGPSGYPFEQYVGELLRNSGYEVSVGVILEGRCIRHEVDVLAESGNEIILVECKYRNSSAGSHDVKTALYVHARHEDLRCVLKKKHKRKKISGWLVTNTRFTDDAIKFAECSGMKIVSWRYPQDNSLERMIEKGRLYPVTVLPGLNKHQVRELIEHNIFLLMDFIKKDLEFISRILSINSRKAAGLRMQAEELCRC